MISKGLILRGVDIGEGIGIETFPCLVFSEVLLNDNCGTVKFDKHLSLSNLSFSFFLELLHFLYMWAIVLRELLDFVLKLMHTNVTIAAKVTWLL
jgi:hypothetical protein